MAACIVSPTFDQMERMEGGRERGRGANCKEPILIERRAIEAPWKIRQYGTRNWKGRREGGRKWGLISRLPRKRVEAGKRYEVCLQASEIGELTV